MCGHALKVKFNETDYFLLSTGLKALDKCMYLFFTIVLIQID